MLLRRPRAHPEVLATWDRYDPLRRAFLVDAAFPGILGLALVLGGWQRAAGPAYTTLRDSGGPYAWGTALMVLSVLSLAAPFCPVKVAANALRALALAVLVLGLLFAHAWQVDPHASLLGCLFACYVAWQDLTRADLYLETVRA